MHGDAVPFLICSLHFVIHVAVPMDTDAQLYFDFQKCKDSNDVTNDVTLLAFSQTLP